MGVLTVFDWAQVKIARDYVEYLTAIFSDSREKQNIINQLANAGGVSVIWDDCGNTKLEGSWPHILKAQALFEQYLSSVRDSATSSTDSTATGHNCLDQTYTFKKEKVPEDIDLPGENEVYVDITLSGSFDDLHPKVPEKKDSVLFYNNSEGKTLISSNLEVSLDDAYHAHHTENVAARSEFSNVGCFDEGLSSGPACNNTVLPLYRISQYEEKEDDQEKQASFLHNESDAHVSLPLVENENYHTSKQEENVQNNSSANKTIEFSQTCDIPSTNSNHSSTLDIQNEVRKPVKQQKRYVKKKDYEELAPFKFFCSLCSFKSKRESHFQKHMKLHNEASELFRCGQCSFTSIRLSHLRRHELSHCSLALACTACHYRTSSHKHLARHKRIKHSNAKVSEVTKEILSCSHCDYETTSLYMLDRHLKIHVKETSAEIEIFQCEQCEYRTSRREHLVRHCSAVHAGRRPFLCHHCGKAFKRHDALAQHALTHTAATLPCPCCARPCRSRAHLAQHMTVHSNDRAFLCELCGASFKTRAVQRKHMHTVHQHPKAFMCIHCTRKFSTKFALRRHIKQHSVEQTSKAAEAPDVPGLGHEPAKLEAPGQAMEANTEDKMILQVPEPYDLQETLHVFPEQTLAQPTSEATALVYLAAPFAPYNAL